MESLTLGQVGALCVALIGSEVAGKLGAPSARTVLLLVLTNFANEQPKDNNFKDSADKAITFHNPVNPSNPIGCADDWKSIAGQFNTIDILGNCQAMFNKLELYEASYQEKQVRDREREEKEQIKAAKEAVNNPEQVLHHDLARELIPNRRDVSWQHKQTLSACKEVFGSTKSTKDFYDSLQEYSGGYVVPPTTTGVEFSKEDTVLYNAMSSLAPVYDHLLGLKKTIGELHPNCLPGTNEAHLREEVELVSVLFCQTLSNLEYKRKTSYKSIKPYVSLPFAETKKPLLDTAEAKEVKKTQQAAKLFSTPSTNTTQTGGRGYTYGSRRSRFRGYDNRRSSRSPTRSNSGGRGRGDGGGRGRGRGRGGGGPTTGGK